ncbi:ArnT family glycosyltransferase [Fimbriiglobus ruber]|uniref:Polymyxin resistance protein n=1 Tax=Fimbriiglobus ruber TaxID=1908690 RepID=A0A225DRA4_9BACT|nr:glycosyltransferase family 39 protein [Fimbriiglobus ruber]OWK43821.1 Polymyxin resistance protein [Fimbriiglobus ruber]
MSAESSVDPLPRTVPAWLPFLWSRVLFPGAADTTTRVRLVSLLLVFLLPAALLYPSRSFMLLEPDEGRYAQIPKEMLDRGDWVVPTLQGEPYLDKPPLMYWLVKLSYTAFGVNESAARLVPAVCVHLTILAVYFLGRRSIGERGALWASMLLTIAPGYIGIARLLLLDGLLTLCVTTSVLAGFEAVRTGRFRPGWWIAAAVCSGLGFLTKGPISEVLLFPPLFAFAYLNGNAARVSWKYIVLFAGIVIAVNTPWYVAIYAKQPEFLKHFFWEHNVMRFVQPFDHLQPVWYYAPLLLGGFLPGMIVAIPYVRSLLSGGAEAASCRSQAGGFWLLAGAWCVVFFSVSGSKLPTYILPAFPPLCLALGEFVARSRWNRATATRGLVGAFAVVIAALNWVGVPWYARERSPMGRPELVEKFVHDPSTVVVTYPRNCDSVAFYTGRSDLKQVRSKDINQFIVDSHFRPKTVILFTHNHSCAAFKEVLPPYLRIADEVSLRHKSSKVGLIDRLVGGTPWGLCDVVVLEPIAKESVARAASP